MPYCADLGAGSPGLYCFDIDVGPFRPIQARKHVIAGLVQPVVDMTCWVVWTKRRPPSCAVFKRITGLGAERQLRPQLHPGDSRLNLPPLYENRTETASIDFSCSIGLCGLKAGVAGHSGPQPILAAEERPMTITAEQLGHRLRIARGQISQDLAAAEIGVPRSAVSLMETGQRQVSTLELTRLATLYGRPIEWFVNPNDAEEAADPVQALFRQEPGLAESTAQIHVGRCVQLFRDGSSLLRLLGREPVSALPRHDLPAPRSTGSAIDQGQMVAEQERRRLDLGNAPIRDLADLIWSQGVWAATLDLPQDMSGLFLSGRDFGLAVIANGKQDFRRCRFSLAHEYGHALMDRDQPAVITQSSNRKDTREQRANAFAATFLMPTDGVREFLHGLGKGHGSRREEAVPDALANEDGVRGELRSPPRSQTITVVDAALVAEQFGVSYPAALWRLLGLGQISSAEREALQKQTTAANRYIKTVRSTSEADDAAAAAPPKDADLRWQILPLAMEAWRRELITSGRLTEIARHLEFEDTDSILELAELLS